MQVAPLHVLLSALVSLPLMPWLLTLLGLLLALRWRRAGWVLALFGLVLMYCTSVPALVYPVAEYWSRVIVPTPPAGAQAIVVLGAGRSQAPEYGHRDGINRLAAQRLRYAAWLARRTGLPILVSGGLSHDGKRASEAQLMQRSLQRDFRVKVRWLEGDSANTWENARNSARILKPLGIDRILLVTQAWSLPRAMWSFRKAGLTPLPAPAGYMLPTPGTYGWSAWLPNARAAHGASLLWHEMLGMLWYRLHYG
ncbi:MAG: YdcF family protein [Acidihalobacter sp.]|uniref:YdcF family protein n=1 Tax=Acidihalobacter sp. TaxID=1872108 RepID=UPI00307D6C63